MDTVPLRAEFDVLLLDLDGTVYHGARAVPAAVPVLADSAQMLCYITNNASRAPEDVAAQLTAMGLPTTREQVLTSAQSVARLVSDSVPAGSAVLVLGTDSLMELVREAGLVPTRDAEDGPVAVVHGHNPHHTWGLLSEGALAIHRGARYFATNGDTTLPTERGLLLGNGSLVAAIVAATGVAPAIAGKPHRPIMDDALARTGARRALVIGDRLDTDIEGGHAADLPTLHVLTGVSGPLDVLAARADQRPTYVALDLNALEAPAAAAAWTPAAGAWECALDSNRLTLRRVGEDHTTALPQAALPTVAVAALREVAPRVWAAAGAAGLDRSALEVIPSDPAAEAVAAWWAEGWKTPVDTLD